MGGMRLDAEQDREVSRPGRPPAREAALVGVVGLALMVGLIWWVMSGNEAGSTRVAPRSGRPFDRRTALYVGNRECRECHPGETALHSRSGHARTLRPAAGIELAHWMDGRSVPDPERPGVNWSYALEGGKLAATRTEGGRSERFPLDYAFGSGHHATTFVTLTDPDPDHPVAREHRLTYFDGAKSLGMTPGQASPTPAAGTTTVGRVLTSPESLRCFDCHTTITSSQGQSILDSATMVLNISCERCHGPGRRHVEAARRGDEDLAMPLGPGRVTAPEQMLFCGGCHRHPSQLRPGEIRADNPDLIRFQPVGLMQSACYVKSRGALSCVTCHDPHARAATDATTYEATCLSCHRAPEQTACPVSPDKGCIGCHMPRKDAGQGVLFTDHWIRAEQNAKASNPEGLDQPR
jgi:hypothetical protein